MDDLSQALCKELAGKGAVLTAFGDLSGLPADVRAGLPVGVSVAVRHKKDVIRGICDHPTPAYLDAYDELNARLDTIVLAGAELLRQAGWLAVAKSRDVVKWDRADCISLLPHKTVATRAGMGWIGKCALLVTEEYGSMIRISSILTDAPLQAATPVDESRCGACDACRTACPANAVSGKTWTPASQRADFFDALSCQATARKRALEHAGKDTALCGRCIAACPYTKRYLAG